jgi:hypothetical protein
MYWYVLVYTSTYKYIPVYTSMYWYVLVYTGTYYYNLHVVPVLRGCCVWSDCEGDCCAQGNCAKGPLKPIVLLRLVGAGGRTERDPMKCAVWFPSVPVRTSMYQYVLVCTMNRLLNLSSFEIRLCHIVSHA